ncbi:MAG TPA: hypothetical protein VLH38_02790 [Patescibacteria group bacterium]|nr:hypothetical protein [Patescibacteria group bacterium]
MATSKNPTIQKLMDEVDSLDVSDQSLEAKMQQIAEAIASEQRKLQPATQILAGNIPVDPSEAFACEGCQ